ncbi:hypothetical protein Tco_1337861 [Tanacetum coccineum]
MVKFVFHLLDLSSGTILLYQKLLEFKPRTEVEEDDRSRPRFVSGKNSSGRKNSLKDYNIPRSIKDEAPIVGSGNSSYGRSSATAEDFPGWKKKKGTLLIPLGSELELHLSGDEFLRCDLKEHRYSRNCENDKVATRWVSTIKGFLEFLDCPGVHGVHDEKRVWFEVELQGAQGIVKLRFFRLVSDTLLLQKTVWWTSNLKRRTNKNTECLVKDAEKEHQTRVEESRGVALDLSLKVISKWKAGLKDDMDARSDVYVLSNGCRKCSDDSDGYYWEYTLDLLEGQLYTVVSVSNQGICDVEKMVMVPMYICGWDKQEIRWSATRLDKHLQMCGTWYKIESWITDRRIALMKEIWLQELLTKSQYMARVVAGIATGALVKGDSLSKVPAQVEVLPSLILDDSCISDRDFSLSLMGTVKDITAMPNLYVALDKKGFSDIVRAKEMEAQDPFICNDSYESESSDNEEDAEDDVSQTLKIK